MRSRDAIWVLAFFAVGMFALGKFATWGIEKWDWAFVLLGLAVFLAIGIGVDWHDRRRRSLIAPRRNLSQERNQYDQPE